MYNLDFSLLIVKLQARCHIQGVTLYITLTRFLLLCFIVGEKLSNKNLKKMNYFFHSLLDHIDMKIRKVAKNI